MKYTPPTMPEPKITSELEREIRAAEALPCPCCGGTPKAGIRYLYDTPAMYIVCSMCGIQTRLYSPIKPVKGPELTMRDCFTAALNTWNRRPK